MTKPINNMTVDELIQCGTLDQKVSTMNAMINSLYGYNKAPIRDIENQDCRIACISYDKTKDEVYGHFENVEE